MDRERIKGLAEQFERVAQLHAGDSEVSALQGSLAELINASKKGELKHKVSRVPGAHFFSEGGLAQYADLESAYAKFKIALVMGDEKKEQEMRDWAEKRKQALFSK